MDVSVYWPECTSCHCLCVRVISNQSTSRKPRHVSALSKLDTLLYKTHSKVLLALRYHVSGVILEIEGSVRQRYKRKLFTKKNSKKVCRCISFSKITHQMWCDYPFSQRNKVTKRAVRLRLEARGIGGGVVRQNLKKGRGVFINMVGGSS